MFVVFLIVLTLFAGLGIDIGFAYITKAQLSKAVDAAALAGVKNLGQGTVNATSIANATFLANYGLPGRDTGSITPTITWSGSTGLTVNATATINTFFIRVLPAWKTLSVSANATSARSPVIMTLVLDRSGSMNPDTGTTKGGCCLATAVANFIALFDDNHDQVAMVSFASTANVDFPIGQPFKSAITTAANNFSYAGGTFSAGGLALAIQQNGSVPVVASQSPVEVVVFFTDGKANMIQQTLSCSNLYNFGGYDTLNSGAGFWTTNTPETDATQQSNPPCSVSDNGALSCSNCTTSTYISPQFGEQNFTTAGITSDAEYEGIQLANQMRAQGMYVFSIGLSADPNDPVNLTFLQEVANDPSSPIYDNTLPTGATLVTPDPSQLDPLFQAIAAKILLRLTQ